MRAPVELSITLAGKSGAGRVKFFKVYAQFFQSPCRGAVAAGPPAPHVLVGVNKDRNAFFPGNQENFP